MAADQQGVIVEWPQTGERVAIDSDVLPQAIKSGYKIIGPEPAKLPVNMGAPSPAAVAQSNLRSVAQQGTPQFTNPVERLLQSLVPATGNLALATGKVALGGVPYMAYQNIKQGLQYLKNPPTPTQSAAAALGVNSDEVGQQIQSGNYAGATGSLLPPVLAAILGARELGSADLSAAPKSVPEMAADLTNKVNPLPKKMSGFQANLTKQLPNVIQRAQDTGVDVGKLQSSPQTLANVLKDAAAAKRATYYAMLKPIKDSAVDVSDIPNYDGGTVNHANFDQAATLGQLDARLTELNNTLKPKYDKGGADARAAVGQENTIDLAREAAGIRSTLYSEIGQRVGIDPSVVADTKASMGALDNLAQQVQLAANLKRFKANVVRQKLPGQLAKGALWATGTGAAGALSWDAIKYLSGK